MALTDDRADLVTAAKSLHDRGYAPGNTGNLSLRTDEGYIITPTNSCLGRLSPDDLSVITLDGTQLSGLKPSKELALHIEMYAAHPDARAIVHLHSLGAVAASCLSSIDPTSVFSNMTAYQHLRVQNVVLAAYAEPGSSELTRNVREATKLSASVLLANHGSIVARESLDAAVDAIEQFEQTALLAIMLDGRDLRLLPTNGSSKKDN
jgi:ribulose-5-phosphate 4-epimerase/fuculose-1-phosphate aldolase